VVALGFLRSCQKKAQRKGISIKTRRRRKASKSFRAGLKAPSHNHLKEWEFILIKDFEQRKRAVDLGVLKTQQDWHYIKLHRIARACRINNNAFVRYLYCQICFIYLTDAQDKMQ
jgi:hypothetical protein